MRPRLAIALALTSLCLAAGCGGDDSPEPNGVEAKSAEQIVADAADALSKVKSFHAEGTEGGSYVVADIEVPDKVHLAVRQGRQEAQIIGVERSVYINANEAYWRGQNVGRAAPQLAGRWLKSPTSTTAFRELTSGLDPQTLSRCLRKEHGSIEKGPRESFAGQPAVVVIDKGDRPGTAPGKLYVATTGEPLPIRTLATANERPGGKKDPACDSDGSRTKKGDEATFSHYNEELDIKAPPGAVDLSGSGATGAAS